MTHHRDLFEMNADGVSHDRRLLQWEARWIEEVMHSLPAPSEPPTTLGAFEKGVESLLSDQNLGCSSRRVAESLTRSEFSEVIASFAVDGLTEAWAMLSVLPRVPPRAQMPLVRVLLDEFGCGNLGRSHSQLYRELLQELGLPIEFPEHLHRTPPEVLALVNLFFWLARRAPHVDFYLGAFAYFEASIPTAYVPFVSACERLGITHSAYFGEHIHIDAFHAREAILTISETAKVAPIDYRLLWQGLELARAHAQLALDAAVRQALAAGSSRA